MCVCVFGFRVVNLSVRIMGLLCITVTVYNPFSVGVALLLYTVPPIFNSGCFLQWRRNDRGWSITQVRFFQDTTLQLRLGSEPLSNALADMAILLHDSNGYSVSQCYQFS